MASIKSDRGFTLLELTCALFIVTVAGFGAIQLYSTGMDKILEMREGDVALEVLRNEIEFLRARAFNSLESTDNFATTTPAIETLHAAVSSVTVKPATTPGLKEVTVSLRWQSLHGRWIERSLTTLIADKGTTS